MGECQEQADWSNAIRFIYFTQYLCCKIPETKIENNNCMICTNMAQIFYELPILKLKDFWRAALMSLIRDLKIKNPSNEKVFQSTLQVNMNVIGTRITKEEAMNIMVTLSDSLKIQPNKEYLNNLVDKSQCDIKSLYFVLIKPQI